MHEPAQLAANAEVPAYVVKRVGEILEQEQLTRFLPEAAQHRVRITPPGIVRVSCECVHGVSGGMSS